MESWAWIDVAIRMLVDLMRDFLLPLLLGLVSSGVAVATVTISLRHSNRLQRAEREAGENARRAEAYRGAAENVLIALAHFVSLDPLDEDMRGKMRELRARAQIFQTLTRGESEDRLGVWLALECQYGLHLFIDAMAQTVRFPGMKRTGETYAKIMDPPHAWAGATGQTLAMALRPPVNDAWVQSRVVWLAREVARLN